MWDFMTPVLLPRFVTKRSFSNCSEILEQIVAKSQTTFLYNSQMQIVTLSIRKTNKFDWGIRGLSSEICGGDLRESHEQLL